MTLIDQFVASWVLLVLVLFEIVGVCYIYGKYNNCGLVHVLVKVADGLKLQLVCFLSYIS